MKNIFFASMLFSVAWIPPIQAQDLKTEMQALAKAFQEANNRGDADALNAMYANEVVMVNQQDGSKMTVTKAEIREQDARNFSVNDDKMNIVIANAERLPDGKVQITGTVTGVSTNKQSGKQMPYSGAFEHQLVKESTGWVLCQMKFMPN